MRPAALLLSALTLLAACATPTAPGSPSASHAPSASVPASAAPSASPDASTPPEATASPDATATAEPATPAPSMTSDEAGLVGALRADAATDCAPRRTGLPEGALYGVECKPADPLVARVGIYWFASPNEAARAYLTRMATYGVGPNEGDCVQGKPGETAWTPGDGEGSVDDPGVFVWDNAVLSPNRAGCFRDENGTANVRATCDQAYIGVLGRGKDLAALQDWIWVYPEGYEPGTPDSPGICIGDGLPAPDLDEAP